MKLDKSYFFCGIGGSGMLPLALIVQGRGARVAGSDRTLDQGKLGGKFDFLRARGIPLFAQDGTGLTSADQILIASAAVEETVLDVVRARELGAERMTRAQLLAELFNDAPIGIAVAGTSGKSTVTGMIGWILHASGRDPTVMNGAVMKNFVTPDAPFATALVGQGEPFVSEVDESDGSIALYRPKVAVLNNISLDHKSMEELRQLFGDFIGQEALVVANADDEEAAALLATHQPASVATFSVEGRPGSADLVATNIAEEPFAISFDVIDGQEAAGRVRLAVPGRHNVSNALAALLAAAGAGVSLPEAMRAIEGFSGLKRRFELVGEAGGVTVIDDFGHNPDKIAATLRTLHAFPGRLLLFFQPHGFGPLKTMGRELAETFASEMSPDDVLVMADPVYHGGTTDRTFGSETVTDQVAARGRHAEHVPSRAACAGRLVELARSGDRIVVMGARDDTLSIFAQELVERLG
ncbi:MAG TPA: Mur ligase family protein [Allosphingosinicella sp.]|nr:Mur ligase family protein [Allosphingosinicella sp.]